MSIGGLRALFWSLVICICVWMWVLSKAREALGG